MSAQNSKLNSYTPFLSHLNINVGKYCIFTGTMYYVDSILHTHTHTHTQMDTAVRLSLLIFKIDNSTSPGQQLDIDIFYINPNLTANQQQSSIMRYEGEIGVAMLSLSFMVSCTANYYGFDCGVYCNKSFGNYGCNETDGPIICVEGYRNETVNCTQCIPALGCCKLLYPCAWYLLLV